MSEKAPISPKTDPDLRSSTNRIVKITKPNKPLKKAGKRTSISERLRKSGLDPQKLLDLTLPISRRAAQKKTRHLMVMLGFLAFVAIPTALTAVYMFFYASDQYHSTAAFAVRTVNNAPATEILGMVLNGGGGGESASANSYIINDYLQSQAIIEALPAEVDLEKIYNRQGADWLFRMGTELPIEAKLSYWQDMVEVIYDATSGVIYVEVVSFRPEDSQLIANVILQESEKLVNQLSEKTRRQSVLSAEKALASAEARLKAIQKQLLAYRERTQEVSPEDNARLVMEMISRLEQQLIQKEAERKTLLGYLNESTPRIRILSDEIESLKTQVDLERKRLGSGLGFDPADPNDSISFRLADYSELKLEEEFAKQMYATALAGLESARREAASKSLYLATFIKPTLSQEPQYPSRFMYVLTIFLLFLGAWLVSVLMYYNIRDRS
jgi:capsular polysaccharide transport system permease protein